VLRTDCPAMLGRMARRVTHCAHFVRCVRTDATSQTFRCALRARPCALRFSAPHTPAATDPNAPLRHDPGVRCGQGSVVPERQVVPGRERICGDEQRRAGVGARSAHLTSDSPRLFERNERSE